MRPTDMERSDSSAMEQLASRRDDECPCGSGLPTYWVNDAQNIPLAKVCDACRSERLAGFRPEILTGYTQADVDEPIEEP